MIIFGIFKEEYLKYVAMLWPSSETISKKLTACKIHIIELKVKRVSKKNIDISAYSFLKIFFFIEIFRNFTYIFSTFSLQLNTT